MHCPYCAHVDTQVLDTRISEDGASIRRRRRCASCDRRFTTYERAEVALPVVVKKNGSRADYDRGKLSFSLHLALRKRPVSAEAIDAAIVRIEDKLMSSGDKEVPSDRVGELVMRELRKLDKIAYVRFASVYRSFEDVDEFADVIREVAAKKTSRAKTPGK
jgi:transcriptional repressor NrdR